VIKDEDHQVAARVQHRDDIVHRGEPKIVDISRELFEAHSSTKPVCNPGNVKLIMRFDRKP